MAPQSCPPASPASMHASVSWGNNSRRYWVFLLDAKGREPGDSAVYKHLREIGVKDIASVEQAIAADIQNQSADGPDLLGSTTTLSTETVRWKVRTIAQTFRDSISSKIYAQGDAASRGIIDLGLLEACLYELIKKNIRSLKLQDRLNSASGPPQENMHDDPDTASTQSQHKIKRSSSAAMSDPPQFEGQHSKRPKLTNERDELAVQTVVQRSPYDTESEASPIPQSSSIGIRAEAHFSTNLSIPAASSQQNLSCLDDCMIHVTKVRELQKSVISLSLFATEKGDIERKRQAVDYDFNEWMDELRDVFKYDKSTERIEYHAPGTGPVEVNSRREWHTAIMLLTAEGNTPLCFEIRRRLTPLGSKTTAE